MLKKRFYDILTIIFIVLLVVTIYFQIKSISKTQDMIFDCTLNRAQGDSLESCIDNIELPIFYKIVGKIMYSLLFIYWLFILVLSIQLHKKDLTKTVDVVVIAIISPLAFIFYLTNLRKSLKKYEASNPN
jgi:hypothetical protein